jgi:hypothetical protein
MPSWLFGQQRCPDLPRLPSRDHTQARAASRPPSSHNAETCVELALTALRTVEDELGRLSGIVTDVVGAPPFIAGEPRSPADHTALDESEPVHRISAGAIAHNRGGSIDRFRPGLR